MVPINRRIRRLSCRGSQRVEPHIASFWRLIRFGPDIFRKVEYDVDHDGDAGQADEAELHGMTTIDGGEYATESSMRAKLVASAVATHLGLTDVVAAQLGRASPRGSDSKGKTGLTTAEREGSGRRLRKEVRDRLSHDNPRRPKKSRGLLRDAGPPVKSPDVDHHDGRRPAIPSRDTVSLAGRHAEWLRTPGGNARNRRARGRTACLKVLVQASFAESQQRYWQSAYSRGSDRAMTSRSAGSVG